MSNAQTMTDAPFFRIRVLHIPTFDQQIQALHDTGISNPMTVNSVFQTGLLAACLCAGLYAMEEGDLTNTGLTMQTKDDLVKRLAELSESSLHKGDWHQNHRLESLQIYL